MNNQAPNSHLCTHMHACMHAHMESNVHIHLHTQTCARQHNSWSTPSSPVPITVPQPAHRGRKWPQPPSWVQGVWLGTFCPPCSSLSGHRGSQQGAGPSGRPWTLSLSPVHAPAGVGHLRGPARGPGALPGLRLQRHPQVRPRGLLNPPVLCLRPEGAQLAPSQSRGLRP